MLKNPIEIIKESLLVYKHYRRFLSLLLLSLAPALILTILSVTTVFLYVYAKSSSLISSLMIPVIMLIGVVFSLWVTIALAKVIKTIIDGQNTPNWKDVLLQSTRLVWPSITASILVSLILLSGTILSIVIALVFNAPQIIFIGILWILFPGIIFIIWYIFTFYAVIFDEKRNWRALKASKELVTGRWWSILWRWFLPVFFSFVVIYILNKITNGLVWLLTDQWFWQAVVAGVIGSVISITITPFSISVLLIIYLDAQKNPINASPIQTTEPPQVIN